VNNNGKNMLRILLLSVWLSIFVFTAGCNHKGYVSYPVSGTVKYADGSVPVGEITTVLFSPKVPDAKLKSASGNIQADGKFVLSTIEPDDGAYPGEYKVTVSVLKTYLGSEQVILAKFTNPDTTPLVATVGPNEKNVFDFVVEKAP
jgi:hypothetical protein